MDISHLATILVPLAAVAYWITGFLTALTNKKWNDALTRIVTFSGAFVAMAVYAHSSIDLGGRFTNGQDLLGHLNSADLALLALIVASGAGGGFDFLRAINTADTSVPAKLLPPEPAAPAQTPPAPTP